MGAACSLSLVGRCNRNWPITRRERSHSTGIAALSLSSTKARFAVAQVMSVRHLASDNSLLFAESFAIATPADVPVKVVRIDRSAADQLGIDDVTLLAMRPDGYVGLRSDQDHLRALQHYCTLIHEGNLDG
jgi:hypothetical protein